MTTDAAAGQAPHGSPFWRFSLAFYRDGDVAKACLDLQDRCEVDVNLLLFLLWMARSRRVLDAGAVRALDGRLSRWRSDVVVPLRAMRRRLKIDDPLVEPEQAAFFRARVKVLELESERLQQDAMHALSGELATEAVLSADVAARANVKAYESVKECVFNQGSVEILIGALLRH